MAEQGLDISVNAQYLPDHSEPSARRWFFAYRVRILNQGPMAARVQRRHWVITDGHGDTEEVEGAGVIGATPWLPPSAAFEYTSYCPLSTPSGMMRGSLLCSRDDGSEFSVDVPPFDLLSAEVLLN
jgi:ApaG protein